MYRKGDVILSEVSDSRQDCDENWIYKKGIWFHLPHSCNEWVIGSKQEALLLIEDLQKLIATPIRRKNPCKNPT